MLLNYWRIQTDTGRIAKEEKKCVPMCHCEIWRSKHLESGQRLWQKAWVFWTAEGACSPEINSLVRNYLLY